MNEAWRPKWEAYQVAKRKAEDLMQEVYRDGLVPMEDLLQAAEERNKAERDFLDAYPMRLG